VTPNLKRLVVVAALIQHPEGGKLLVARRHLSDPPELAGRWEFPGGKVEPGEEPRAALEREVREELGIAVTVGHVAETLYACSDAREIIILCYWCQLCPGVQPHEAQPVEVLECRWQSLDQLEALDFVPADRAFVARLAEEAKDAQGGRALPRAPSAGGR